VAPESAKSVANSNILEILLDFCGGMLYNTQLTRKLTAYELEVKSKKVKGKSKSGGHL
jgi:hypothetical protein